MNIPPEDIAEIVKRCKKGDQEAYSKLVDLYSKRLYSYFYRMTGNTDISGELLSELFLKVVKYIKKFKGDSFESWIYRIASNVFNDFLRQKQRKNKLINNYTEKVIENQRHTQISNNPLNDKLQTALDKIGPDEKQLILLRYYSEMSFKEIAEFRSEPVGTTLSKMHRTLKKLKIIMAKNNE